jgi:hypothetical protein
MKLKLMWRIFLYEVKAKRQGLIIGALVGLAAAHYFISKGADLNTIVEGGKGVVDAVFNRQSAIEVAKYKMYLGFAFFGALIGYLGEVIFEYLGLFKRKKVVRSRRRKR